jgi:hypothetical protein
MAMVETGRTAGDRPATTMRRVLAGRAALWAGFALVHALVVWLCLSAPGFPMGDVDNFYRVWAENARAGFARMGIDAPWVYPILAFVPMALALLLTVGPLEYGMAWLVLVVAFDAVALGLLVGRRRLSRTRRAAAWWWLAFIALLGPIALARIDTITVPLGIIAVLFAAGRPRVAAALLTIATWIKVWPAALGVALVTASRRRLDVVLVAVALSALIVVGSLLAGSGWSVFAFITGQTDRGLQIEAPVATFWLWQVVGGVPGAAVVYSRELNTFQVDGAGVEVVAGLMTPVLAVAVAAIALLGIRAVRRGAYLVNVLPPLGLALVAALIAFNKVGSPQFIGWLAAPVVLFVLYRRKAALVPATLVLAVAALTQLFYPYWYDWLLVAAPAFVVILTARNVLEFVILGWAVRMLWQSGRRRPAIPARPS